VRAHDDVTPTRGQTIPGAVQVHLVDGTYELFRCFYGAPPRTSAEGREIGAVSGLVATMLNLLKDATHVAVAFDTVIESFRNDLFKGYKTSAGIDANLWAQFPIAEEATKALGLVTWGMIDLEADDALASGAARYATQKGVDRVVICSPDKDLCQCVSDARHVITLDRRQKKMFDEAGVVTRLGVPPASVPDLLGLVGDTADGIPGLDGFGEKSAGALLTAYGTIDAIPDDHTKWSVKVRGADKLAATLRAHRKDAALYKVLATLRTDAKIPDDVEELRWRGPDEVRLAKLAALLRDDRLIERVKGAVDARGAAA